MSGEKRLFGYPTLLKDTYMDAKTSPTNVAPHVLLTVALTRTIVDESLEEVSSEEKAYSRGPEGLKGPGAAMSWKF